MPITREEFENRGIDFRIHILRILRASPDDAYSETELTELVGAMIGLVPETRAFAIALRELEAAGAIEEAIFDEVAFWVVRVGYTGERA